MSSLKWGDFSMENYYEILQVSRTATLSEIKSAYKNLALTQHPDLHPNNPIAEENFKKINEAYHTLSDMHKRSLYDVNLNTALYRKVTYYRTSVDVYKNPSKQGAELSARAKTTTQVVSIVFFMGFLAFTVYFHGFMNRFTARVHLQEAIEAWESGQVILALATIQKTLSFDKTLAEAYFLKAKIYDESYQNYTKAILEWDKGLKYTTHMSADLWLKRAEWNVALQNYRSAIDDYTQAINLQSMNGRLYYERAMIKIQLANEQNRYPSDACEDFKIALNLGFTSSLPYVRNYCSFEKEEMVF